MNPEIKQKWVAALRSGEYQQGRGKLRKGDTFCCLGVLCDLHGKDNGIKWDHKWDSYFGNSLILPSNVAAWAGIVCNPTLGNMTAADHNDGTSECPAKSFPEIAALIEQNL